MHSDTPIIFETSFDSAYVIAEAVKITYLCIIFCGGSGSTLGFHHVLELVIGLVLFATLNKLFQLANQKSAVINRDSRDWWKPAAKLHQGSE
jgi:hypothetical protein